MKKLFFILFTFAFLLSLQAQQTKGVRPVSYPQKVHEGKTYALILGISKYKNAAIPSLQFADKDAIAFSNYLIANGVDSNNIMLLLNEKATNGEFWASISFLTDVAKDGDKVYIYFSGHGDVENKTVVKDAYLLPYDAPKCVYPAGAIAVPLLKSWIATLSSNGIQAVFIADACRSGNLAGGKDGMEAAASMLKDKWQDEIKILSCQPGELSLEGKQWGNGRGLFSYELINGLAGLADKNKDEKVTLRELSLFLMEKVADEANPLPQNPMLFGNMETELSIVNKDYLNKILIAENKSFDAIDVKGFDEGILKSLPDSTKKIYRQFKICMDSNLIYSDNSKETTAYSCFRKISENNDTKLLLAIMRRNLAAKFIANLDSMISNTLNNSTFVDDGFLFSYSYPSKVFYELLGAQKINTLGLNAKLLYNQALEVPLSKKNIVTFIEINNQLLDSAIRLEPNASYILLLKVGTLQGNDDRQAISISKRINSISPKFAYPYRIIAECYRRLNILDSSNLYFTKLKNLDTAFSSGANRSIAVNYLLLNQKDSSDFYFSRYFKKTDFEIDLKTNFDIQCKIGDAFYNVKQFENAIDAYKIAIKLKPEAKEVYYNIACNFSLLNNKINALNYFELSLKKGLDLFDYFQTDTDLNNIRKTKEFKKLLKKYFPERFKK